MLCAPSSVAVYTNLNSLGYSEDELIRLLTDRLRKTTDGELHSTVRGHQRVS